MYIGAGLLILLIMTLAGTRYSSAQSRFNAGQYRIHSSTDGIFRAELWWGDSRKKSGQFKYHLNIHVVDNDVLVTLKSTHNGGCGKLSIFGITIWHKCLGPYIRFLDKDDNLLGTYVPNSIDRFGFDHIIPRVQRMLENGHKPREIIKELGIDRAKLEHIAFELGLELSW